MWREGERLSSRDAKRGTVAAGRVRDAETSTATEGSEGERERRRAFPPEKMASSSDNRRGGEGSVVSVSTQWSDGACRIRLSSFTHGLPGVGRPMVSGLQEFRIHRHLPDGSQNSCETIGVLLPPREARCLASLPEARAAVLLDVREHDVQLSGEALDFLVEILSIYISGVAAARVRKEVAPLVTDVCVETEVWMPAEQEDEEDDAEDDEEDDAEDGEEDGQSSDDDYIPLSSQSRASANVQVARGNEENELEEAEEEQRERCVICLEKMAAAGGEQEICWLPCAHSFHTVCVGRWLRRKGQCPICRQDVRGQD